MICKDTMEQYNQTYYAAYSISASDYKECNLVYQQTIHYNINDYLKMYVYS